MVHLLGKVWHITYLYEVHELLCLRVRRAFRLVRICVQDTQMYMKWVGGCRNAVSEEYGREYKEVELRRQTPIFI